MGEKTYNLNKILLVFLTVSIVLHFSILFAVYKFPISKSQRNDPSDENIVDVRIISPKDSRDMINDLRGQIVDIVDERKSDEPVSSQFLSDKNRQVSKQTQALLTGNDPNAPFTSMGGGKREDLLSFKEEAKEGLDGQDKESGRIIERNENSEARMKDSKREDLDLNPTREELSRFFTVAPNNYLPDVEIGNSTLLNTKRFAYAGFFVRMKRQLESIWNPRPVLSRSFLEKKFPYLTSLTIVLGPKGELLRVDVLRSSGVRELDLEAIRAVRKSAPFPNPPRDLLSGDNQIHIPRFDFIIPNPRGIF